MVNQPGKEILFAHFASNLLKSGNVDEAIKICEQGLKKFPTYAQAHYILARCYIRKKLNDEARAELERVLRYEPNHIKAIRDLAGLYFTNGFQDLYKEYLMQLFTLDPMNVNVIEEAKKLGEYKLWKAEPAPEVTPEIPPQPDIDQEKPVEKENVFIESEKEIAEEKEVDPIFPDKIDLSQFDNVEDDFTTILHGKMEYSGKTDQSKSQVDPDLADIAKDIIEEPDIEESSEVPTQKEEQSLQEENVSSADSVEIVTPSAEPSSEKITNDNAEQSVEPELSSPSEKTTEKSSTDLSVDEDAADAELTDSVGFEDEDDDKFEQPKIISQTLGEILVSQQKYVEAKAVFEALKEKQPDNKALDLKIEYLDRIIGLEKDGKS